MPQLMLIGFQRRQISAIKHFRKNELTLLNTVIKGCDKRTKTKWTKTEMGSTVYRSHSTRQCWYSLV